MPTSQSRRMGSATRIYRNSDNCVIAIDDISVTYDSHWLPNRTVHNSVNLSHSRQLLYLGTGDRIVASIQMIGDFESITEDSGNYLTAVWATDSSAPSHSVGLGSVSKLGDAIE